MRATNAFRSNTNCRKPRSPQVETLIDDRRLTSDPTIILRAGLRPVIRSNDLVGHVATILRRYRS
jgi:hypothetical protein